MEFVSGSGSRAQLSFGLRSTVLGLGAILASVVWAQSALRLVAGLYLLCLGIGMVRNSLRAKPEAVGLESLRRAAFGSGFIASITNPKALVFFGSAFAFTSPAQPTLDYNVAAVIVLTVLSALWHSSLAVIFATPALQRGYQSLKRQIDLCVGVLLVCLGGGMLTQALRKGDDFRRIVIHYAPISLASWHTHIVSETSVLGRLSKTAVSAIGAIATKAHLVRQADHCAPRDEGGFQCLAVTDCLQRDPIGIGQNGFGGRGAPLNGSASISPSTVSPLGSSEKA